jgi:hypothetical protein
VHTYTEWSIEGGFRRLAAVSNAISDSSPGDVVMLEMQAVGAGGDYGPAELDPPIYTVCSAGTAAGIVIVGAAGNGNQDLDSAPYASYKAMPDSGAILVGAGSADTLHAKLSFSTYGSRLDVQGWGENVFSLGYGDAFAFGGPGDSDQYYTGVFNGTSSATPFVTACCVILQQQALAALGEPLDPTVLRYVLAKTGIPQEPGPRIGPFPNLPEALAALPDLQLDPWVDLGGALAGTPGLPQQTGTGAMFPGTLFQISLTNARAFALAWQVLGVSEIDAPFKGGTLVPDPNFVFGPLVVPFNGATGYKAAWPVGLPPGVPTYWQFWIQDPVGPKGFAASNAIFALSQ